MEFSDIEPKPLTQPPALFHATGSLAIGQITFWAATFYLLPALMLDIEQNVGWTKTQISGAMTGAIIVSAICARPVGRIIDTGYGAYLMGIGGTGAGLLLVLCSQVELIWQFYGCWLGLGACMAAILYEPCFSIVTRHHGINARRAITHITLIAGFAGTIAYPLATWLSASFDWRVTFIFFGFFVLMLAVPCTLYAILELQKNLPAIQISPPSSKTTETGKRRSFWLIAGAFTLGGINHTMILSHLLPMLSERGISTQLAVFAAMLIGPMQVVARLMFMTYERQVSTQSGALICLWGLGFASALLWLSGINLPLIYAATALHGATWGLVSIARPTLIREVLGGEGFGATSGSVATIAILGVAIAPSLGAWLWSLGGYQLMLSVGTMLTLTGGSFIWLLRKQPNT